MSNKISKNIIEKMIILCVILAVLVTASLSGDKILWKNDAQNGSTPKSSILNRVLSHNRSTGYAGLLPVSTVKGKKYILLSKERTGSAKGTYCDLGGKVDARESMGDALLREGYEESSRVYDFRNHFSALQRNSYLCYSHFVVTAFYEVSYKKRSVFMKALAAAKRRNSNHCFWEKSNFIWVEANSLLRAVNIMPVGGHSSISVKILNDDGSTSTKQIRLRDFFAKTLKNSKGILAQFVNHAPVVPANRNVVAHNKNGHGAKKVVVRKKAAPRPKNKQAKKRVKIISL